MEIRTLHIFHRIYKSSSVKQWDHPAASNRVLFEVIQMEVARSQITIYNSLLSLLFANCRALHDSEDGFLRNTKSLFKNYMK